MPATLFLGPPGVRAALRQCIFAGNSGP